MISALCALAGLNDEAFYWLENAINKGFLNYPLLAEHETAFKDLKSDERYQALLQRVKKEWEEFPV